MIIRSFGCEQYKVFRDLTSVELRPLTLFFGKNSSGKSALLRLLRLLLRAASGRFLHQGFPLEVDGLSYGENFQDLIHGRLPHGKLRLDLALEEGGRAFDFSATVQNVSDAGLYRPVLSHARLVAEGRPSEWSSDLASVASGPADFTGVWPQEWLQTTSEQTALQNQVHLWRTKIANLESRLTHLGPIRAQARSVYRPAAPSVLSFDGNGFINWLAKEPDLLQQVGEWFAVHLNGWRLKLDPSGPFVESVLHKGGVSINMANTGQGMQQVLPVVVLQLAHRLGTEPFLDLVEEPESSLHAAAQAALGDLFLETAQRGHGQVLVETHSENLLLRIRRRIAEGQAEPDQVALYWIEDCPEGHSKIKRIDIAGDGSVEAWPEGVFSEDYQEVRALQRANLQRAKQENRA
ncbi:MAG: AAA family ATPase [Magnetococcales bacterium]|nr:AAA family ATPase [Magnetococcales bacterium]